MSWPADLASSRIVGPDGCPIAATPGDGIVVPGREVMAPGFSAPRRELVIPTMAPIECGQRMPSGGPAYVSGEWNFRAIQARSMLRARWVIEHPEETFSLIVGTPGCGKTAAQKLMFWEMMAVKFARFMLLIVPNETLATQAEAALKKWIGPAFRAVLLKNSKASSGIAPGDPYCRVLIATYQMLVQPGAIDRWIDEIKLAVAKSKACGLGGGILVTADEAHHPADVPPGHEFGEEADPFGGLDPVDFRPWSMIAHRLKKELVDDKDVGGHFVETTGTPEREDHCKLPFVDYYRPGSPELLARRSSPGVWLASDVETDLSPSADEIGEDEVVPFAHVECSYAEAYREGSLKRMEAIHNPALVKYSKGGKVRPARRTDDASLSRSEQSASVFTAISLPEYWKPALAHDVDHWRRHRIDTNFDGWRMLFVAEDQVLAAEYAVFLSSELLVKTGLAISGTKGKGKGEEALGIWTRHGRKIEKGRAVLKDFASGRYEALVTVSMAGEGYDVPEISHVCYYCRKRSHVYSWQTFTRGVRSCPAATLLGIPSWAQPCFVSSPADVRALAHLERVTSSIFSMPAVMTHLDPSKRRPSGGPGGGRSDSVTPEAAQLVAPIAVRRAQAAASAAGEDGRRLAEILSWLKDRKTLARRVDKKFPGWRACEGSRLLLVWRFVRGLVA